MVVHWGVGRHDDIVILDPNWLVRLLSTLITTKANFVSNGVLLRKNLDMVWTCRIILCANIRSDLETARFPFAFT